MGTFPDSVAEAVLSKFDSLPSKSNPLADRNGIVSWIPLSGIVVCRGILPQVLWDYPMAIRRDRLNSVQDGEDDITCASVAYENLSQVPEGEVGIFIVIVPA